MNTPIYYFCIKEYTNTPEDKHHLDAVRLGPLSNDEPDMVFKNAISPLVEVIKKASKKERNIVERERSLSVEKWESAKRGKSLYAGKWLYTVYELQIEEFADQATLLRWNMMSDTFLQSRYQDALKQLGQPGFSDPTNDTILATALRAAEWFQKNVKYYASPLPVKNSSPSPDIGSAERDDDVNNVDMGDADPPTKISEKLSPSSKKMWILKQAFISDKSLENDKRKPAEIRDHWNKMPESERKKASSPESMGEFGFGQFSK